MAPVFARLVAFLFFSAGLHAAPGQVAGSSLESRGPASGLSFLANMTDDGRYVTFLSSETDLVTNRVRVPSFQVFLRDRLNAETTLISLGTNGAVGNAAITAARVSQDGRFVVFESQADNLVLNDTNGAADVFIRDREDGLTQLVSSDRSGRTIAGGGFGFEMSDDARSVLFLVETNVSSVRVKRAYLKDTASSEMRIVSFPGTSDSTTLLEAKLSRDGRYALFCSSSPDPTKNGVFVRDMVEEDLVVLSTNSSNFLPFSLRFSGNGQFAFFGQSTTQALVFRSAFKARQTDLVFQADPSLESPGYTVDESGNHVAYASEGKILLWDSATQSTSLVSVNLTGTEPASSPCEAPLISRNGRFVAFMSDSTDLSPDFAGGDPQWFLRDLENGETTLLTKPLSQVEAPGGGIDASFLALSADASVAAFTTSSDHMGPRMGNRLYSVFALDVPSGKMELVSVPAENTTPAPRSLDQVLAISNDGQRILFQSHFDGLSRDDTNGWTDLFVHETGTGSNQLVSVALDGKHSGNGLSRDGVMSGNGRYVAFVSLASDLVPADVNRVGDIFVRDLELQTTVLASVNEANLDPSKLWHAMSPSMSADGTILSWVRQSTTGSSESYVRNRSTELTVRISTNILNPAVVSPDGKWVAFRNSSAVTLLYSVQTRSSQPVAQARSSTYTFTSNSQYLFAPNYAYDLALKAGMMFFCTGCTNVSFIPDGNYIVYQKAPTIAGAFQQIQIQDSRSRIQIITTNYSNPNLQGNGDSRNPRVSADGNFIVFQSKASDLVPDDNNGVEDVFVYDRNSQLIRLISLDRNRPGSAAGPSIMPLINNDGRVVVFDTFASGLGATEVTGQNVVVFSEQGSGPLVVSVSIDPVAQTISLSWPSIPGRTYRVEFNSDLGTSNWRPLQIDLVASGASSSVSAPIGGDRAYFFRLILLPI